jgi:putative redox protein
MIEMTIDYAGQLHCDAKHGPSGAIMSTDAPVDNHGRGESFSPTDLLGTALGTCMATVMGIAADRKEVSLAGMSVRVRKFMSEDLPRRVVRLESEITMPIAADHPAVAVLQATAEGCPVRQSLGSGVECPIVWHWA